MFHPRQHHCCKKGTLICSGFVKKHSHRLSVSFFPPLSVSVFIHLHLIVLEVLSHIVTKVILPPARCCSVYLAEKGSSISFFSVNRDPFPQVRTVLPSLTIRKYASQIKSVLFTPFMVDCGVNCKFNKWERLVMLRLTTLKVFFNSCSCFVFVCLQINPWGENKQNFSN